MIITSVNSLLPSHDDIDEVDAGVAKNLISGIDDISILYTFSTLEYLLKDVRVIYLKDIEISIRPLIFISAKEGDMTSVPKWISIILSEQGVVEIHDDDQLSYIKRALNNRTRFLRTRK